PPPFEQPFSVLGAAVVGSFTIETDALRFPALIFENGAVVPAGLFYFNPGLRYDLGVAGQPFAFVSTRPSIRESDFIAIDLTAPRPSVTDDILSLDTIFGGGQFASPFDG